MSARVERVDKDGGRWVITGATQGELETGIVALQKALRKAAGETPAERKPGRPPKNGVAQASEREKSRLQTALAILRAINEAQTGGATGAMLATAAGVPPGKALGPLMGMLGRVVRQLSLPNGATAYVVRGHGDDKRWVAQAGMNVALKKLEEMQESEEMS